MVGGAVPPRAASYLAGGDETFEIIEDDELPKEPAAVMVVNNRGKPRWTVSIPPGSAFPLRPSEYASICHQSSRITERLRASQSLSSHQHGGSHDYYRNDPYFTDVAEAEGQGFLPTASDDIKPGKKTLVGVGEEGHIHQHSTGLRQNEAKACARSLTYVMESTDAGLGMTMMGLWMAYGLAKKEGRAFFIDDTNWAYGEFTTFFKPPPVPSCLPPPANHRVPCPHQTRHLVVSASTSPWTFGTAFHEKFQHSHKTDHLSQKAIFSLLRTGHDALFHLSNLDAEYLSTRIAELDKQIHSSGGLTIGVHIRHGDRHPWEFQYQKSYIPFSAYLHSAQAMITSIFASQPPTSVTFPAASKILLASDDPEVYDAPELLPALRAQSRILLASKSTLDAAQGLSASTSNPNKFVEGNVGWEGGFFSNVFWGLGDTAAGSAAARGVREERKKPGEHSLALRELVARAYLLDLKILGSADGVVCGVSSVGCRLLGVMVGWEGVVNGKWKNVDGGVGWVGFA